MNTINHKHLHFAQIDPLDDGLKEMILNEEHEQGAIRLIDDNGIGISPFWDEMEHDLSDGGGLSFSED